MFQQEEPWVTISMTNLTRTNKHTQYSKGIEPKSQKDGRW
jgi:hypothetical protein